MGKLSSSRANAGTSKARRAGAAVHQHGHAGRHAAGLADEIQALEHAASARDDVLDHQHGLAGADGEAAPQPEDVVFLLRKQKAGPRLPRHLLPDDESAHGGREHGPEGDAPELFQQELREALDLGHMLADLGALEIVGAVQAGAQHEVPLQQRPRAGEDVEHFLPVGVHAPPRCGIRAGKTKTFFLRPRRTRNRPGGTDRNI